MPKQREIYITEMAMRVQKQIISGCFFQRETIAILGPSPWEFLKGGERTCTERRLELLRPELPAVGLERNCWQEIRTWSTIGKKWFKHNVCACVEACTDPRCCTLPAAVMAQESSSWKKSVVVISSQFHHLRLHWEQWPFPLGCFGRAVALTQPKIRGL